MTTGNKLSGFTSAVCNVHVIFILWIWQSSFLSLESLWEQKVTSQPDPSRRTRSKFKIWVHSKTQTGRAVFLLLTSVKVSMEAKYLDHQSNMLSSSSSSSISSPFFLFLFFPFPSLSSSFLFVCLFFTQDAINIVKLQGFCNSTTNL